MSSASIPTPSEVKKLTEVISAALKLGPKVQNPQYTTVLKQLRVGSDPILLKLFLSLQRCVGDIGMDPHSFDDLVCAAFSVRFVPSECVSLVPRGETHPSIASGALMCTIPTLNAFLSFVESLVGSNSIYLQTATRACVRILSSAKSDFDSYARSCISTSSSSDASSVEGSSSLKAESGTLSPELGLSLSRQLTELNRRVYDCIGRLLDLVPTGVTIVFSSLCENYPHKRHPLWIHNASVRHLISLALVQPRLRDRVVAFLVGKAVELDSDINMELLPDQEEEDSHITDSESGSEAPDLPSDLESDSQDDSDDSADSVDSSEIRTRRTTHPQSNLLSPEAAASTSLASKVAGSARKSDYSVAAARDAQGGLSSVQAREAEATIETATKLDMMCLYLFRFVHHLFCNCNSNSNRGVSGVAKAASSCPGRGQESSSESESESDTDSVDQVPPKLELTSASYQQSSAVPLVEGARAVPDQAAPDLSTAPPPNFVAFTGSNGVRTLPHAVLDDDAPACPTIQKALRDTFFSSSSSSSPSSPSQDDGDREPLGTPRFTPSSSSAVEQMFALIMGVFERSVLRTHRSKFTQFIVFYACALHPALPDTFAARLLGHVTAERSPALDAATAASYLGAFLSRAAFLHETSVRSALFRLLEWAHSYLNAFEAHAIHGLCQAGILQSSDMLYKSNRAQPQQASGEAGASVLPKGAQQIKNAKDVHSGLASDDDASSTSTATSSSSSDTDTDTETLSDGRRTSTPLQDAVEEQEDEEESLDEPLLFQYLLQNPSIMANGVPQYPDPMAPTLPPQIIFHSVIQAAMYVVCFRASSLRQLEGGLDFLAALSWPRLLACPLDPLSSASRAVSKEFVKVMHSLRILPLSCVVNSAAFHELVPSSNPSHNSNGSGAMTSNNALSHKSSNNDTQGNNLAPKNEQTNSIVESASIPSEYAVSAPASTSTGLETSPQLLLESFFPFDPYLLRHSAKYISSIYRTWKFSRLGDDEDADEWDTEGGGYDTTLSGRPVLSESERASAPSASKSRASGYQGYSSSGGNGTSSSRKGRQPVSAVTSASGKKEYFFSSDLGSEASNSSDSSLSDSDVSSVDSSFDSASEDEFGQVSVRPASARFPGMGMGIGMGRNIRGAEKSVLSRMLTSLGSGAFSRAVEKAAITEDLMQQLDIDVDGPTPQTQLQESAQARRLPPPMGSPYSDASIGSSPTMSPWLGPAYSYLLQPVGANSNIAATSSNTATTTPLAASTTSGTSVSLSGFPRPLRQGTPSALSTPVFGAIPVPSSSPMITATPLSPGLGGIPQLELSLGAGALGDIALAAPRSLLGAPPPLSLSQSAASTLGSMQGAESLAVEVGRPRRGTVSGFRDADALLGHDIPGANVTPIEEASTNVGTIDSQNTLFREGKRRRAPSNGQIYEQNASSNVPSKDAFAKLISEGALKNQGMVSERKIVKPKSKKSKQ